MGSDVPELRARQLAALRAAYEACARQADDRAVTGAALHTRVLLGRILVLLGGLEERAPPPAIALLPVVPPSGRSGAARFTVPADSVSSPHRREGLQRAGGSTGC
ncbi:hypothetical protein FV242_13660 [Methylobacterium sp. WL64]|nr:hypothetical protein FV242_13660 [Methylobacterium sp. WL64]